MAILRPRFLAILLLFTLMFFNKFVALSQEKPPFPVEDSQVKIPSSQEVIPFNLNLTTWGEIKKTYNLVIQKRIENNFRGYEKKPEFRNEYQKFYDKWVSKFGREPLKLRDKASMAEFEKLAKYMYSSNLKEFNTLYKLHIQQNPVFMGKTEQDILNAVIATSYFIYQYDPELWNYARKYSFTWPFCLRRPGGWE